MLRPFDCTEPEGLKEGVAKVLLKANVQVTDSARSLCAVLSVAFVITYATCQELHLA